MNDKSEEYLKGYADALKEMSENLEQDLEISDATKYGNQNSAQTCRSYKTFMGYEIKEAIENVAERLKENEDDQT